MRNDGENDFLIGSHEQNCLKTKHTWHRVRKKKTCKSKIPHRNAALAMFLKKTISVLIINKTHRC